MHAHMLHMHMPCLPCDLACVWRVVMMCVEEETKTREGTEEDRGTTEQGAAFFHPKLHFAPLLSISSILIHLISPEWRKEGRGGRLRNKTGENRRVGWRDSVSKMENLPYPPIHFR